MSLPRLRFSLRTLVIFVLLCGSGFGLWYRWEPWVVRAVIENGTEHAAFAPDGRIIAGTGRDRKIHLWTADSGHELAVLGEPAQELEFIGFSADGKQILTRSPWKDTQVWDVAARKPLIELMVLSGSARLSHDGCEVFAAGNGGVRVWSVATGEQTLRLQREYRIFKADLSRADQESADQRQRERRAMAEATRSLDEFAKLAVAEEGTHWSPGLDVCSEITPDGRLVLTSVPGFGKTQVWNLRSRTKQCDIGTTLSHVRCCYFSEDGERAALDNNGRMELWETRSGQRLLQLNDCSFVRFSPSRGFVLAGYVIWDVDNKQRIGALEECDGIPSFFPDGSRVLIAEKETFAVASLRGSLLYRWRTSQVDEPLWPAAVSPDGEQIAAYAGRARLLILHRRLPEWWWGIAWLPEFWFTLVFGVGLVWSVWRDRRRLSV
jgi:WD40 repeat protein